MKFFEVTAFEKAKELIKNNMPSQLLRSEKLPLDICSGKIVSQDIIANDCLPNYNRSTVDGYAVRAEDVLAASESIPSVVCLIGEIKIGEIPTASLQCGEAMEISTGAVLPKNCNAVAMVEHTERLGDKVAIYTPLNVRENTVMVGEDLAKGEIVIKKGQVLTPLLIGVLAGIGVTEVPVYAAPKVSIISTGNELVDIDKEAVGGKIRDINTALLSSLIAQSNWTVSSKILIKDNLEELTNAVKSAAESSDIVLISGGSSVGMADYTKRALENLGRVILHGIAIKPGKPTMVAKVSDSLVFGLAGHPLAAALCFKTLVADCVNSFRGLQLLPDYFVEMEQSFHATAGRTNIQPIKLIISEGNVLARPIYVKSAYVARAANADGYILLSERCEGVAKGQKVEVYRL